MPDTGARRQYSLRAVLMASAAIASAAIVSAAIDDGRALAEEASPQKKASGANTGRAWRYIDSGQTWTYRVAEAPLPPEQLGRAAAALADTEPGAKEVSLPPVTGTAPADLPPAGFPQRLTGKSGPTPMAAAMGGEDCDCRTRLGDTGKKRVAVLYATTEFDIGDELDELRILRARVRYKDGVAIHINGVEVARRNLDSSGPMEPARRPRGREWERFSIPAVKGLLRPGKNVVAVEVHPSGHRLAPVFDLVLTGGVDAIVTHGPILQRVTTESATVVFETDLPVTGRVEYVVGDGAPRRAASANGSLAERHQVLLTGLSAASRIRYQVSIGDEKLPERTFTTPPVKGAPLRFAVYGDMRGGHRVHGQILASLLKERPTFVIVTGDLVTRGTDEGDWQRFFDVASDLLAEVPYYPLAGNHDVGKSGAEQRRMNEIFALWPPPSGRPLWGHWYSFDVSDIHFVMLDSNAYEHGEQKEWLAADLKAARDRGARAIFVATHDGPYSRGTHTGNERAQKEYAPLMVEHGVDLLFSGHDHLYQRGEQSGLPYIVSGGGGAPLYDIRCGVAGKKPCSFKDGMQSAIKAHHYIIVTVENKRIKTCAHKPDGSRLERCVTWRLR